MSGLTFTVHGQITSANAIKAPDREGRLRKTALAKEDARRVREIAIVAATGWEIPQAAAFTVYAFNSRLDVGNIEKGLADPIKGVALRDDADLMELHVYRRWDREGERYVVTISACEDERPNAKRSKPRRAFDGLPADGVITDFAQRDEILRKAGVR